MKWIVTVAGVFQNIPRLSAVKFVKRRWMERILVGICSPIEERSDSGASIAPILHIERMRWIDIAGRSISTVCFFHLFNVRGTSRVAENMPAIHLPLAPITTKKWAKRSLQQKADDDDAKRLRRREPWQRSEELRRNSRWKVAPDADASQMPQFPRAIRELPAEDDGGIDPESLGVIQPVEMRRSKKVGVVLSRFR